MFLNSSLTPKNETSAILLLLRLGGNFDAIALLNGVLTGIKCKKFILKIAYHAN